MLRGLFALIVLPSILDSFARVVLTWLSHRPPRREPETSPRSWVVLIPSRDEGEAVAPTLESVSKAAGGLAVRTVLLLDGEDPSAAGKAGQLGAEVVIKKPAGPSKGAALAWIARTRRDELLAAEAILLLDVGSRLSDDFFRQFRWPVEADAAQVILSGSGAQVGAGARSSESFAQSREDRGRQQLGWAVRLRGTGTVMTPDAFLSIATHLETQAEDEEATLLLAAAGRQLTLASGEARVIDEKPSRVADAARQRARWLAGRMEIVARHPGALMNLIRRRPAEGVVFVLDLFGRPLSLTIPLRLVVGAGLLATGGTLALRDWKIAIGAAAVATGAIEAALLLRSGASARSAMQLATSWTGALMLTPRALVRWMRARQR